MNITRENITPFLDTPIPDAKNTAVDAWLSAISAQLNSSFGTVLPAAIAPAVYNIVADAIARRLDRTKVDPRLKAQATGPSSVQYNTAITSLFGWFYPAEAAQLGELFGGGGTVSSARTPAPDGVRFGNMAYRNPYDTPSTAPLVGEVDDGPEWPYGDDIDWSDAS